MFINPDGRIYLIIFLLTLFNHLGHGQISINGNPQLSSKINSTIDYIYNLEFDKSEPLIDDLHQTMGEHSAVYLLKAFNIFWKKKPFKIGSKDFTTFEGYLRRSLELSESVLEDNDEDVEASFFSLAAHAYLAQLYVDNGENLKALSEAKSCYGYIKEGFEMVNQFPEYYFPCGIYNYYREKYPEENPFFKPFLWFFRSGDKEEGIRMLQKGADKAIFTKVESNIYLFHILLRYEEKPHLSTPYAKKLFDAYPNNLNFTANYAESLIFENKIDQTKELIDPLVESENYYFKYVGYLFLGNYQEKYLNDYESALESYLLADEMGSKLDLRSPHMDSQIYLSMGRIYLKKNNETQAEKYFRQSVKKAEFSLIRDEAKEYLSNL